MRHQKNKGFVLTKVLTEGMSMALFPAVSDRKLEPLSVSSLGDCIEQAPCQPMLTIKMRGVLSFCENQQNLGLVCMCIFDVSP